MRMYIDDDSPLGRFLLQHAPGRARTCALYDLYSRDQVHGQQRATLDELAKKLDQLDAKLSGGVVVGGQGFAQRTAEDEDNGTAGRDQDKDGATAAKLRKMALDFDATLQ